MIFYDSGTNADEPYFLGFTFGVRIGKSGLMSIVLSINLLKVDTVFCFTARPGKI